MSKIYTPRMITALSFIGGPLAGAYAVSHNWKVLEEPAKSNSTLAIGLVFTFVMFATLAFLPESTIDRLPSTLLPVTYTVLIRSYVIYTQKKNLDLVLANGGEKYGILHALGIVLVSLLATMVLVLPLVFFV